MSLVGVHLQLGGLGVDVGGSRGARDAVQEPQLAVDDGQGGYLELGGQAGAAPGAERVDGAQRALHGRRPAQRTALLPDQALDLVFFGGHVGWVGVVTGVAGVGVGVRSRRGRG